MKPDFKEADLGTPSMFAHLIRLTLVVVAGAAVVLTAGCTSNPTATATPPPSPSPTATLTATATLAATATHLPPTPTLTATPAPVVFLPFDDAPHDSPIEWWYFNGLLRDDAGGEYSYHFVTFQSSGTPGVTPLLLQASLGDHVRGIHHTSETGYLAPERPEAKNVEAETGRWLMTGKGEEYELRFIVGEEADPIEVELRVSPQRAAVLHGGSGLVELGREVGSTYYYSYTRLDVTGWIEDANGRRPVTGPGWMDHQWGDVSSTRIGWDWASVQFDDGADLMVAVLFYPGGHRPAAAHGTYVDPDGSVTYFHEDDISIDGTRNWTSPDTGVEYPMQWKVATEEKPMLELELTPELEQAEFTSDFLGVSYWEGAVSVEGEREGQSVAGWGFVELVGYDPRQLQVTPPAPSPQP